MQRRKQVPNTTIHLFTDSQVFAFRLPLHADVTVPIPVHHHQHQYPFIRLVFASAKFVSKGKSGFGLDPEASPVAMTLTASHGENNRGVDSFQLDSGTNKSRNRMKALNTSIQIHFISASTAMLPRRGKKSQREDLIVLMKLLPTSQPPQKTNCCILLVNFNTFQNSFKVLLRT